MPAIWLKTIGKVTIVVPVLMTSCQVSLKPNRGPFGAYPPVGIYDDCTPAHGRSPLAASRASRLGTPEGRGPTSGVEDDRQGACPAKGFGVRPGRSSDEAVEEAKMTDYVIRFLIGGVVGCAFSSLGDLLRPKSFAGLFGTVPSVALATLGIAIYRYGESHAAAQTLSMMAGGRRARHLQHRCLPVVDAGENASAARQLDIDGVLVGRRLRPLVSDRGTGMNTPIRISPSALRESRWYECVVRFALGRTATC
jgi:hypothetical protein